MVPMPGVRTWVEVPTLANPAAVRMPPFVMLMVPIASGVFAVSPNVKVPDTVTADVDALKARVPLPAFGEAPARLMLAAAPLVTSTVNVAAFFTTIVSALPGCPPAPVPVVMALQLVFVVMVIAAA